MGLEERRKFEEICQKLRKVFGLDKRSWYKIIGQF